ncbi:MAG: methyltransferase domain-containing protein [Acidobacteriota bacterium]
MTGIPGGGKSRRDLLPVLTSRSETRAFYNKLSRAYDLLAEHTEAPVRRAGLELLAAAPGERILEIGCGTGHCLVDLGRAVGRGGTVCGVDLSEGMLREAARRVEREGLADRIGLCQGDAVALPQPEGSIGAIFMSFTLELFDTPEIPEVLAECRRVLRDGGRIGVVGLSKEGAQGLLIHAFEWTHQHFPNLFDCRPIFVREALQEAGFRIRKVRHEQMWVPVEIVLGKKG